MTETSPVLGLPYIQPAQAQKHVTHNEALRLLDAITQLSVVEPPRNAPPATPVTGARYIVAPGGSGAWAGQDHALALFAGGIWQFFPPATGWRADVASTGESLRFDGAGWTAAGAGASDSVARLGINSAADDTNRLAVASDATLFTHDGTGHQLKINKKFETDTASLLFQTGFSGRAEMGTTGGDDFAIKVSSDGGLFYNGLVVQAESGAVQIPQGQCFFDEATLAQNSAWSRDIPWSDPARILLWIGVDAPGHAYLVSITGALSGAANCTALSVAPAGSLHLASGPLDGTTGPDGALSLAIDTTGAAPLLWLENRLGATRQVTLATLGR